MVLEISPKTFKDFGAVGRLLFGSEKRCERYSKEQLVCNILITGKIMYHLRQLVFIIYFGEIIQTG